MLLGLSVAVLHAQSLGLGWAFQIGLGNDDISGLQVRDAAGNVFVGGLFNGTLDLDPGAGTRIVASNGNYDFFVAKYDPFGNYQWGVAIGGTDYEEITTIDVSFPGIVRVGGYFYGTVDFDPGPGTQTQSAIGSRDGFILQLDANNGGFQWVRKIGGPTTSSVGSIVSDSFGSLFICGAFDGTVDLDPGTGVANFSSNGASDLFLAKLDTQGGYVWGKSFGGINWESINGFQLGPSGSLYLAGAFMNTVDFDPGPAILNRTSNGSYDIYVCRMDTSGNLLWAQTIGSTLAEYAYGMAVDPLGNVHFTGVFSTTMDFDPGTGISSLSVPVTTIGNPYVCKWNAAGNFVWARSFESEFNGRAYKLAIDDDLNIYTVGLPGDSTDFDSGPGTYVLRTQDFNDFFIQKMDSAGQFAWANIWSGAGVQTTGWISLDANKNIYLVGTNDGSFDIDPSATSLTLTSQGYRDVFMSKFRQIPAVYANTTLSSCGPMVSPSGHQVWYTSGSYVDILTSSMGGDSIVTYSLTVLNSSSSSQTVSLCDSFMSPSGLHIWTSSGTYRDTLTNSIGCDSIITFYLTIRQPSYATYSFSTCDSFVSPSGIYTWTAAGLYQDTIPNANGCDSIITCVLTIFEPTSATITLSTCNSIVSPSGNQVWSVSGTYHDTIPNALGCDSLLEIQLMLVQIDTSVHSAGGTLIANALGASYQWIYCDSVPVQGQNGAAFTPLENGNYAVVITQGDCQDTSGCYSVTGIVTNEESMPFEVSISPNPTQGMLQIRFPGLSNDVVVEVYSLQGLLLVEHNWPLAKEISIELPVAAGTYILRLKYGEKIETHKVILEKF